MRIASIAGVTCNTTNIERTKNFYELLGFRTDKISDTGMTALVNWFWIRFELVESTDTASISNTISMKVLNLDDFYKLVQENNIKVIEEPQDKPWGVREFKISDPDGNLLSFFEK